MADAETILNLWYIHDEMGVIYSLLARAYVGTGTEKENLALLQRYANVDYLIARPFPIPDRFHVQIVEKGKTRVLPVTPPGFLSTLNNHLALWEDAIKQMEADLPGQMGLSIPDAPLYCSTALLMDDAGRVFSGRRLLRLKRKDENVEVVGAGGLLRVRQQERY
jgi:hypothetical protein